MKTFLISLVFCFMAQAAHAVVQFEVQPKSLKTKSQVLGVQTGNYEQQKGIIFTGRKAQQIADEGDYDFDSDSEMIVMTGPEVDDLIAASIYAPYEAGRLVLITSAAFATLGTELALGAIYSGAAVAWLGVTTAATVAKTVVYYTIQGLEDAVYVVSDTGMELVYAPFYVVSRTLEFVCSIPDYFGLGFLDCY